MKNIVCNLVAFGDDIHLHIGYEHVLLPNDAKLIQSFNVSDVYLHFDSNHSIPEELL